jgi:hypothetical protein
MKKISDIFGASLDPEVDDDYDKKNPRPGYLRPGKS